MSRRIVGGLLSVVLLVFVVMACGCISPSQSPTNTNVNKSSSVNSDGSLWAPSECPVCHQMGTYTRRDGNATFWSCDNCHLTFGTYPDHTQTYVYDSDYEEAGNKVTDDNMHEVNRWTGKQVF